MTNSIISFVIAVVFWGTQINPLYANTKSLVLNDRPLNEIKLTIAPYISGYLWGKYGHLFCPNTVHYNSLTYKPNNSTDRRIVFTIDPVIFSRMAYCNDGAPQSCTVTVFALRDNTWDIKRPAIDCE